MIVGAFQKREPAGTRALLILSGLALIVFGVLLCAHPGIGAVTIALLFGLFNPFLGISSIVAGIELRRTGKTLDSMMQPPGGMQKPGGAQQQPVTS